MAVALTTEHSILNTCSVHNIDRLSVFIFNGWVCTIPNQELLALSTVCVVQWRQPIGALTIDISACINQQAHYFNVVDMRSNVQWRIAIRVLGVDIRTGRNEFSHNITRLIPNRS
ncbi:hypothetical protein BIY45_03215 [Stenotrophomonas sp. BIIR7]|nr:hypothetical protein BIY45_03215 [Stenotrophomonas sp. BIIR7]